MDTCSASASFFNSNAFWTYLGVILGAITSILTTILIEWIRKPKLIFHIKDKTKIIWGDELFWDIMIEVENKQLPKYFKWLQRSVAERCYGFIKFAGNNGNNNSHLMPIRWSQSPQPVPPRIHINNSFIGWIEDYNSIIPNNTMNISAGQSELFDVVIRFPDEEDAYGWNNESYNYKGRNPNFKLEKGEHTIEAEIIASNTRLRKEFILINGKEFLLKHTN